MLAEVGAEAHWSRGVKAMGGQEPKESPVGMLTSSPDGDSPWRWQQEHQLCDGGGRWTRCGGEPGLSCGQKVEGLGRAEDGKEVPLKQDGG